MPIKPIKPKSREEKKKEAYEDLDYLKQVDRLPLEQSRKYVIDVEKDRIAKEAKRTEDARNSLEISRDAQFTYRNKLSAYGQAGLESIIWPEGWARDAVATSESGITIYGRRFQTQEGILIILKSPRGEVFVRGIRTTNDPVLDTNAIDVLVTQAENTLDSSKGILLSDNIDTTSTLRKTKSGIILPN